MTPELRLDAAGSFPTGNRSGLPYRLDPIAALALGAVAAPVIAAAGVMIAILSKRSPFIAHERVGAGGKKFWMWKLRTMWPLERPDRTRPRLVEYVCQSGLPGPKPTRDERVTSRFALFCRKFSIDELPQLFHVVAGQMSLVGPRPITREELLEYYGAGATNVVLSLRPGITGLWQIEGRSSLSFDERRHLDLCLVHAFSLRLYLSVLIRTVPRVLRGTDAC